MTIAFATYMKLCKNPNISVPVCHTCCHSSKCFCSMYTPICQKLKKIDSHIINSSYLPPNEPNGRNYKSIALERPLTDSLVHGLASSRAYI